MRSTSQIVIRTKPVICYQKLRCPRRDKSTSLPHRRRGWFLPAVRAKRAPQIRDVRIPKGRRLQDQAIDVGNRELWRNIPIKQRARSRILWPPHKAQLWKAKWKISATAPRRCSLPVSLFYFRHSCPTNNRTCCPLHKLFRVVSGNGHPQMLVEWATHLTLPASDRESTNTYETHDTVPETDSGIPSAKSG